MESLGKEISYEEFKIKFLEYRDVGKNKLIQDYSCVFYVHLWDNTSNKEDYKKRLAETNDIFLHYLIKNDPWVQ